ncbi:MAG: DMT family transporter [Bacteroidales bacterium]|nr:DMT family transporter [Bacteroidales bacterium]
MWSIMAVMSAVLLGLYDVAKKKALQKNGVLAVLLVATALSTLFLAPFFRLGPAGDYLKLGLKAVLVTVSWISGMIGLKLLPITTVSTIKGSRPVFVVLLSIIIYGEHLNWMQWSGIALALLALYLLGRTSRADGTVQARRTGFIWMGVSVVTGVASALYDKHIITGMEPLFVQCWTNLFITAILAVCVLVQRLSAGASASRNFRFAPSPPQAGSPRLSEMNCPPVVPQGTSALRGGHGRPQFLETEAPLANRPAEENIQSDVSENNTPGSSRNHFQWDWMLVVVAVLITGADALYFFSLKEPGALLSVISVIRRASVLVTFVFGAILFKEGNLRAKGLNMLLMAAGVVLLLLGS